ncbi:hypothetical protein R3P38DRAFT_2861713, partial [Favolaschia claudopus]
MKEPDHTDHMAGIAFQPADSHYSLPFSDVGTANARIAYLEEILQKQSDQLTAASVSFTDLRASYAQERSTGDQLRSLLEQEYLAIRKREHELEIIEAELRQKNDEAVNGVGQDLIHKDNVVFQKWEAGQLALQTTLDEFRNKEAKYTAVIDRYASDLVNLKKVIVGEREQSGNNTLTRCNVIVQLTKQCAERDRAITGYRSELEQMQEKTRYLTMENGHLQKKLKMGNNMLEDEESEKDELRNKIKSMEIEIKILESEMLNHRC